MSQRMTGILGGLGLLGTPSSRAMKLLTGASRLVRDSRTVGAETVFVNTSSDAAERLAHAEDARRSGAALIIGEDLPSHGDCSTSHGRWSFARAHARCVGLDHVLFRRPLVGVTGSAGKSTTVHAAWWALGKGAARIGTIGLHDGHAEVGALQTTPPPEVIHDFLRGLGPDCPGTAMEISSHAADQQRVAGLVLAAVAITGIGHDHLDYHQTQAAYVAAKLKVIRWLRPGGRCIINADDPRESAFRHAAEAVGGCVLGLGWRRGDARLHGVQGSWRLRIDGVDHPVPSPLPGDFNAWNIACGALLAEAAGIPLSTALARLASMPSVPGRLELLARDPDTYVDYAHTPEAIATMLGGMRRAFPGRRLIIVFGCGGDRDPSKRAPMGEAAMMADLAIVTTDNARGEDPAAIAAEVVRGMPLSRQPQDARSQPSEAQEPGHGGRSVIVADRGAAIRFARAQAGPGDLVVIAGKGHETTQTIGATSLPWDDRAFVAAGPGGLG